METVALKSGGKQMEWSRNATKQAKIIPKIFLHFFVYSPPISAVWTARKQKTPPFCAGGHAAGNRWEAFLITFSATEWCGAYGNSTSKE